jgi:putative transposase
MILVIGLSRFLRSLFGSAAAVARENLALRHQLMVLQRSVARPRLAPWDRVLWVWLSRVWPGWRSRLLIVQPATVLAWHRQGFQFYWRWRSSAHSVGRPRLDAERRHLIQRMARENRTWGRRRIQAELALLSDEVAELTVAKYLHRAYTSSFADLARLSDRACPRDRRRGLLPRRPTGEPSVAPPRHWHR